ncbi:MAG: hypothetical protein ACR5LG_00940 [Sodalis sp. (in: enterobacteria)]
MYKNSDGLRQPLFTLTRTADNTLVAYAPGQHSAESAIIAHRVSLAALGLLKHHFPLLIVTLVGDTRHTAVFVQWQADQRRQDLFCLPLLPGLDGSRYELRFSIMDLTGAAGSDAWIVIRHYSEKHRR